MEVGTVAVVVRTKDRPALLARALDDIAAQTLLAEHRATVRVVIVNDGGDAGGVAGLVAKHPIADLVTVVDNASSRGRWPAANQGIAAVDSDYIVLHDDDDTWQPGFLASTTSFLDEPANADYAGVVTFTELVHETGGDDGYRELSREPFAREIEHISLIELCRRNQFPPIAYLYRRRVHDTIGGYNEAMTVVADWEFNLRTVRRFDLAVLTEHLANWHLRSETAEGTDGNVTRASDWQYDEHKVRLFNRLLREELDAGALGVGYLANLLQVIDREEQQRDANVHLHMQQLFDLLRDRSEQGEAAILGRVDGAVEQLLAKPNSVQQLRRSIRRPR
ncbi:glycosyltransferase family A protein [Gryllotalpicola reticulitermitis]|uniref:Glycosyltransferase family A protein n=1 Tax=Gryllotalpicola reticulitermitis TaxID=1184153 RepID=A0ABV8Q597_9MICO